MTTSIRLNPEMQKRLNALAVCTGRSKAYYLRMLIENGIDEIEDYYLAEGVLERVRQGQEQIHSASNVRKDLGLES